MADQNSWLRNDLRWAAWLLAANVFLQVTALGADGALLGSVAATANCAVAAVLIIVARPPTRFFLAAAVPLLPIAAGILWAVWPELTNMSAAAHHIAPDLVASDAARAIGNTALLLGAASLGHRRGLLRIAIEAMCAAAAVNLVIGLALRQIDSSTVWGIDKQFMAGRFTGTMLNANAMGAVYGAVAVLAIAGALSTLFGESALRRPVAQTVSLYLLLGGATLAAAGLTGSRTAFFAAAIGVAVLVALAWSRVEWSNPRRLLGWAAAALPLAILLAGGLAAMQRVQHLGVDAQDRVQLWTYYGALAAQAGPHGFGLGSFSAVNTAMLPIDSRASLLWYVNAAHNAVLQMIIEGGVPYALLVVIGLAMIAYRIVAELFSAARRGRTLLVALIAALVGITLTGLVDISLNVPAVATLAAALLGLGWGHSIRRGLESDQDAAEKDFGQMTPPYRS